MHMVFQGLHKKRIEWTNSWYHQWIWNSKEYMYNPKWVTLENQNTLIIKFTNLTIEEILDRIELDLTGLNSLMCATAIVLQRRLGVKPKRRPEVNTGKKPMWKVKI